MHTKVAKIGIVSDRASAGVSEDISSQAIRETLDQYLSRDWQAEYRLIQMNKIQLNKL